MPPLRPHTRFLLPADKPCACSRTSALLVVALLVGPLVFRRALATEKGSVKDQTLWGVIAGCGQSLAVINLHLNMRLIQPHIFFSPFSEEKILYLTPEQEKDKSHFTDKEVFQLWVCRFTLCTDAAFGPSELSLS